MLIFQPTINFTELSLAAQAAEVCWCVCHSQVALILCGAGLGSGDDDGVEKAF